MSDRNDSGFSLVETLVALAILAAMTAMLASVAINDARARGMVRDRRLAALVARSALDRATVGEGADSGRDDGLDWRVSREPYRTGDPFDRLPLERVAVTVSNTNRRPLLMLTTLRVRR